MICPQCNREVEVDHINGKPHMAKGYCKGTETCLQQLPSDLWTSTEELEAPSDYVDPKQIDNMIEHEENKADNPDLFR